MIEKVKFQIKESDLNNPEPFNIQERKACKMLIDTVNELQTKVNKLAPNINFAQPEVKENVQDEFAEQRKWRHKLCWFWDDGCCDYIGVLYEIHNLSEFPFENDLGGEIPTL